MASGLLFLFLCDLHTSTDMYRTLQNDGAAAPVGTPQGSAWHSALRSSATGGQVEPVWDNYQGLSDEGAEACSRQVQPSPVCHLLLISRSQMIHVLSMHVMESRLPPIHIQIYSLQDKQVFILCCVLFPAVSQEHCSRQRSHSALHNGRQPHHQSLTSERLWLVVYLASFPSKQKRLYSQRTLGNL